MTFDTIRPFIDTEDPDTVSYFLDIREDRHRGVGLMFMRRLDSQPSRFLQLSLPGRRAVLQAAFADAMDGQDGWGAKLIAFLASNPDLMPAPPGPDEFVPPVSGT